MARFDRRSVVITHWPGLKSGLNAHIFMTAKFTKNAMPVAMILASRRLDTLKPLTSEMSTISLTASPPRLAR